MRAGRLLRRLTQLGLGLALYGASLALIVRAGVGQAPWDVLHVGVTRHLPLSLGAVIVAVSLAVLVLWIPLRQQPGLGTVANAMAVGVFADLTLIVVDPITGLPVQLAAMVTGVVLNGMATAAYIGSQLGPGPRDGLMTGLARVTGRSTRLVRTVLELSVVAIGFSLGGTIGIATVVYALAIGPVTQALLPWLTVELRPTRRGQRPDGPIA